MTPQPRLGVTQPTVVISGAGVAGPSVALWLSSNGYRVTVVETAYGLRPGGQTVDLRGAGGEVVARIGLMPQMRRHAMQRWPFRAIASRIWFTAADAIDLPDYQTHRQLDLDQEV